MKSKLMYVELKTNYSDDGPAWIGKAFFSRTCKLVYFNGLAFSKESRNGGNHFEVLSGDYYWISGVKKKGINRHWAGGGKIQIERGVIAEYLELTKTSELAKDLFEIVDLNNEPSVKFVTEFMNMKF